MKRLFKEPIPVFCHLKSDANDKSKICLSVKNKNICVVKGYDSCPNSSEEHYSFSHVFDSKTNQRTLFNHVALPLIKDLLKGKNGVLFMHGVLYSEELLTRSIEIIFNSISNFQPSRSVVQPDHWNGFKMLSLIEKSAESSLECGGINNKKWRRNSNVSLNRDSIITSEIDVCPHKNYSVFVSNVEIYKNFIYDLLEDSTKNFKRSKILKEDSAGDTFVFGAAEREVKSTDEALNEFEKGQVQRNYLLETLKSKPCHFSQTVFNIKIVQTPSYRNDEYITQDKENSMDISQLSLVYFNATDCTSKTEVFNPNLQKTKLMDRTLKALQCCFKAYRESQIGDTEKIIPCGKSKLTLLFQSYFKKGGKIRMLVSIDPVVQDYESVLEVLKFAETRVDVEKCPSIIPSAPSIIPEASSRDSKISNYLPVGLESSRCTVFPDDISKCLKYPIPSFNHITDDSTNCLMESLSSKILRHKTLVQNLTEMQENFRMNLALIDRENVHLKQENIILQQDLKAREFQIQALEQKLLLAEERAENLKKQNDKSQQQLEEVRTDFDQKNKRFVDQCNEIEDVKKKLTEQFAQEKKNLKRIMDKRFAAKQAELKSRLCFTDEKLKQLRDILNSDDWDTLENIHTFSVPESIISVDSSNSALSTNRRRSFHTGFNMGGTKVMKLKSTAGISRKSSNKNSFISSTYEDLQSIRENETLKPTGLCSSPAELLDKSLSVKSGSTADLSKREPYSFSRLDEKSLSIYPESVSNLSRKLNKTFIGDSKKCNSKDDKQLPDDPFRANKKQNISVFSIKKENFSNQASLDETEVKQLTNLPFVYRMRSNQSKQTKFMSLRKAISRPFSFYAKGGVFNNKSSPSKSKDLWIEHKPLENLEIHTALEPSIKKKKSVYKLKTNDVINTRVSKYILQHQEYDSRGEIETQIYKGEIIHSLSGGVQVIFTDVEKVCPVSALTNPQMQQRKKECLTLKEIEKRCTISLECHGHQMKRN